MKHQFRKKWGQNFLRDPNIIRKIINCLDADKNDYILEIGPGDGALTDKLHGQVQHIHGVEIDPILIKHLKKKQYDKLSSTPEGRLIISIRSRIAKIIKIIFNIYLWLICSNTLQTYNIRSFIYILCSAGIAVAISLFFIQGVEQLPFPRGALMFHPENVMKSCLLFFICTVPLIMIVFNKKNDLESLYVKQEKSKAISQDDLWEEATAEDLQSGRYESL